MVWAAFSWIRELSVVSWKAGEFVAVTPSSWSWDDADFVNRSKQARLIKPECLDWQAFRKHEYRLEGEILGPLNIDSEPRLKDGRVLGCDGIVYVLGSKAM